MRYVPLIRLCASLALILVLSALPLQAAGKSRPEPRAQKKEPVITELKGDPEFYEASAELESLVNDMARIVMSYSMTHDRGLPGKLRDDLNACDRALVRALKAFPIEEKARLRKLKEMIEELKPLCEEVIELDELCDINIREAVDSAAKAGKIMRERFRDPVLFRKDDKTYRLALTFYYEMDINLSEMLSRYLFFIASGREDMKKCAEKDMAILSEALDRFLESARPAGVEARYCNELRISICACMRSIQDAAEDCERLKPRVVLLQDRVFVIDHFIDIEIQKSPLR